MDTRRFDNLARALVAGGSRRRVLLAAATLALGIGAPGDDAVARPSRPGTCRPLGSGCTRSSQCCTGGCAIGALLPRSRRNRCTCTDSEVVCDGACVDIRSDAAHCGACGEACPDATDVCFSGVCYATCTVPTPNVGTCGANVGCAVMSNGDTYTFSYIGSSGLGGCATGATTCPGDYSGCVVLVRVSYAPGDFVFPTGECHQWTPCSNEPG